MKVLALQRFIVWISGVLWKKKMILYRRLGPNLDVLEYRNDGRWTLHSSVLGQTKWETFSCILAVIRHRKLEDTEKVGFSRAEKGHAYTLDEL